MKRGYIGVAGQNTPLPRRVVRHHDLQAGDGVLVASVEGDSPAERAGLRTGDVIVGLAGRPIGGIDDLHRLLADHDSGRALPITVIRRAEKLTLTIVPAEAPGPGGD